MKRAFWLLSLPLHVTASTLLYSWRRLMTRLASRPVDQITPVYRVSVAELQAILVCGIREVEAHRSYVNRINVYPVADGDTGSNMVHTLTAVRDALASQPNTFSALFKVAASAATLHARGNSGIILSQYLAGFLGAFEGVKETASGAVLVRALALANQQARAAIDQPLAGTIFDVFAGATDGATTQLRVSGDWVELMEAALTAGKEALEGTKKILPAMQRANVVDAGGAGFLYFLAGCLTGLKRRQVVVMEEPLNSELNPQEVVALEFRYCTEAVVREVKQSVVNLKVALAVLGDSLHVVTSPPFTKIHIHTNEPGRIRTLLEAQGKIEDWKVDDMQSMHAVHVAETTSALQIPRVPLAFVVDSSMDMPSEWPEDIPLFIIPLPVAVDNLPMGIVEEMPLKEFYQRMRMDKNFVPRTSQPSPEYCHTVIQAAMQEADQVVCLSLSAAMSGTYRVVSQVAQAQGEGRVIAMDTQSVSAGIALLAECGAQYFREGGTLTTMIQRLYDLRNDISIFLLVQDLTYLERGGRISRIQSLVGRLFGIQPLLTVRSGRVEKTAHRLVRPRIERRIDLLLDQIRQAAVLRPLQYVYVMHADAEEVALQLAKRITDDIGLRPQVAELNRVIGSHVGPGTLAVGFL